MESHSTIDSLFRRESGRLMAVLTRIFGPSNLELAEDVVQEAFASAVTEWGRDGIPDNPSAWLMTTARNRAIDAVRRERTRRTFASDLAVYLEGEWTLSQTIDEAFEPGPVRDDQLRMIFMCCHARLAPENRITLILKTLCGLSVPAIARALLTTESTINKRLYRTRQSLKDVEFVLPSEDELPNSLDTVHTALYLVFNEGHLSTGDKPILRELCRDAMSLTKLLVDEPKLSNSQTVALLALMCFNAARMDSRIADDGGLVPLDRQDRRRWDVELINRGFEYLEQSSRMEAEQATRYHLEAAIAARHCSAREFDQTDWKSICLLYERLMDVAPSVTAELNHAVAISYRDEPGAAIPVVESMHREGRLPHSHVVPAVLAHLYARAGSVEPARRFLQDALSRATTDHERSLMQQQFDRALEGS